MKLAFALQQRMVIDNTNVTVRERAGYINEAKANRFKIIGYFFESEIGVCIGRNERRSGKEMISKVGVISKYRALQLPSYEEGFNSLYTVKIANNEFVVDSIEKTGSHASELFSKNNLDLI